MNPSTLRSAKNPFTVEETLEKLRHYLVQTKRTDAVNLLEKAVNKAREDSAYAAKMEQTLLHGSTIECREWLSDFGEYMEKPRSTFPFYPYKDAVNAIDTALFHIKIGDDKQAINDFNFLHN